MRHGRLYAKTDGVLTSVDYKKTRNRVLYAAIMLVLAVAALISIFPVFWIFVTSFKTPAEMGTPPYHFWPSEFKLGKVVEVFNEFRLINAFKNSLIVVVGAVICSVLFNGVMGYALAVVKPAGSKIIFGVIMAGYMIPAMTGMVPLYMSILSLKMQGKLLTVILPFGANAFYLVMFKSYFESLPSAVFEAGKIDGCTKLRMFFSLVLPLSLPIIGVISIFTATAAWSDFLLPYLTLRSEDVQTLMVRIYNIQVRLDSLQKGPDTVLMLLSISVIPLIVLFTIFQKQIMATTTTSGIK